ncbi:TRAP transporter small permease [Streptomyces sp. 4N509B]|uniref:TRAP transporter small permease n=1 Tax=Streptomyces sp. 4N509B TaxID=3457413 RepID=UPI003FD1568E
MRTLTRRLLPGVASVSSVLAGACLTLAMLGLVATAALRYVFGGSWPWLDDLQHWTLAWTTFLGAAALGLRNDHIAMDALSGSLPPRARRVLDLLGTLVCLACALLLCWLGWVSLDIAASYDQRSVSGTFPSWIGQAAVPVGCLLMALTLTHHAGRLMRHGADEPEPEAGPAAGQPHEETPQ